LTVHIDSLAAIVIAAAIGIGLLVYRWTAPTASGTGASRGDRLATAIVAAAAAGGLLAAALSSTTPATGQAPPLPATPTSVPGALTPTASPPATTAATAAAAGSPAR
jgi:hypothetical protein